MRKILMGTMNNINSVRVVADFTVSLLLQAFVALSFTSGTRRSIDQHLLEFRSAGADFGSF